jgi:hypothetical protein
MVVDALMGDDDYAFGDGEFSKFGDGVNVIYDDVSGVVNGGVGYGRFYDDNEGEGDGGYVSGAYVGEEGDSYEGYEGEGGEEGGGERVLQGRPMPRTTGKGMGTGAGAGAGMGMRVGSVGSGAMASLPDATDSSGAVTVDVIDTTAESVATTEGQEKVLSFLLQALDVTFFLIETLIRAVGPLVVDGGSLAVARGSEALLGGAPLSPKQFPRRRSVGRSEVGGIDVEGRVEGSWVLMGSFKKQV